jgi:hypothetical protein
MLSDIFVKEAGTKKQFHGNGKTLDPIIIPAIGFFYGKNVIEKHPPAHFIKRSLDELQRLHSIADTIEPIPIFPRFGFSFVHFKPPKNMPLRGTVPRGQAATKAARKSVLLPGGSLIYSSISIELFRYIVKRIIQQIRDFFNLFLYTSDMRGMEGMTVSEIARELEISVDAARKRIETAGIQPITREALYDPSIVKELRKVKMGRPPKAKPEGPAKAAKPAKK